MLSAADEAFLGAIRAGQSAVGYARDIGRSDDWAKWKSREVRRKLGVSTIKEAMAVSEQTTGLSAEERAELERLKRDLKEAREDLRAARTPAAKSDAREDVRDAEEDIERLARRTGLTREELEAALKEKRYREHRDHQARYEQERAAKEEEEKKAARGKPGPKPGAKPKADEPEEGTEEVRPASTHWSEKRLFSRGES